MFVLERNSSHGLKYFLYFTLSKIKPESQSAPQKAPPGFRYHRNINKFNSALLSIVGIDLVPTVSQAASGFL